MYSPDRAHTRSHLVKRKLRHFILIKINCFLRIVYVRQLIQIRELFHFCVTLYETIFFSHFERVRLWRRSNQFDWRLVSNLFHSNNLKRIYGALDFR